MSNGQLKAIAERIERLMDERDGIQSDIRDIYAEAKSAGFVPKVLRKAITRKRMDGSRRDEEDAILELYEGALSGPMRQAVSMAEKGATARQIETETGIDQATVARSVSLNKKPETEETQIGEVDLQGVAPDERGKPSSPAAQAVNPDPPPERVSLSLCTGKGGNPAFIYDSCGGGESRPAAHQGGDAEALPPLSATSSRPGKTQSLSSVRRAQGTYPTALAAEVAPGPQDLIQKFPVDDAPSANAGGDHDAGLTTPAEEVARVAPPPAMISPDINALLASAKSKVDALSPAERDAMLKAQAASFARAELAFGSDAQEASDRARHTDDGLDIPARLNRRQKASA